jgi:hypothetical protein
LDLIRREIGFFRDHGNVDLFLDNTRNYFRDLSALLIHLFSVHHHYPSMISRSDLLKSPFVNEKTFALMDYYKVKKEKNEVDLFDGMDFIVAFMTNFGVRFEDTQQGPWCHVLDF